MSLISLVLICQYHCICWLINNKIIPPQKDMFEIILKLKISNMNIGLRHLSLVELLLEISV